MKVLEDWNLKSNKILASVPFPYLYPVLISPVRASPFKSQIGGTGSNMSVLPGPMLNFHRAVDLDQKKKKKEFFTEKNLVDGLRGKKKKIL